MANIPTINVQAGDSPKLYFYLRDIYGNPLDLELNEFEELSYSVAIMHNGVAYPLEDYQEITDGLVWESTPQTYPENASGSKSADGWNLCVFPYVPPEESGDPWISPFSEKNATYVLNVNLAYFMNDPALEGAARYRRSYKVKIVTGNE